MTDLEWTPPQEVEVGSLVDVPIRTQSALIVVRCHVLDQRVVYGRVEYLVEPVEGSGETWVQESSFEPDSGGAAVVEPSKQNRRRGPSRPKIPKIDTDQPETLDERIRKALET